MAKKMNGNADPEISAISEVYAALDGLDPDAQSRILNYVADKLKLQPPGRSDDRLNRTTEREESRNSADESSERTESPAGHDGEMEGISPGGKKWITRSGLRPEQLASVFSVGGDEIDLIAKSVPGSSKAARMRSVILLKGIAAYLATGATRLTDQEIRGTCLHYDALDARNFATTLKGLSSEVTGTKETGYTLSPRGMASATELVKELVGGARAAE